MLIITKKTDAQILKASLAEGTDVYREEDDAGALDRLVSIAEEYDIDGHDGKRLECYMILDSMTTLWLLQTTGIGDEIQRKVDVFATTTADMMAKSIFLNHTVFPPLDRTPISKDSESVVHLVIAGNSDTAEAIAINAALVAHFPNYCRDNNLRTRITIVDDDIMVIKNRMERRYTHLFDNSFHRYIDLNSESPQCHTHKPRHYERLGDIADIEWEFVNGNLRCEALRTKLSEWSKTHDKILTIAIANDSLERNMEEAASLPLEIYRQNIPIICHCRLLGKAQPSCHDCAHPNVLPFDSSICSIGELSRLKRLAMGINYVYCHCLNLPPQAPVAPPPHIDIERMERLWDSISSLTKQYSNIFNAMTLNVKMHSLGHDASDSSTFYAVSRQEIEILTEVEHNRWNIEELILGYRPVEPDEEKAVEGNIALKKMLRNKKIHYDIRSFADLRNDATGKNVNVYDMALSQGIPLIIKTCTTN